MNNAIIDFLRTKIEWNIDELMDITGFTDKKLMKSYLYMAGFVKTERESVYVFDRDLLKRNNRNFMNAFRALMNSDH